MREEDHIRSSLICAMQGESSSTKLANQIKGTDSIEHSQFFCRCAHHLAWTHVVLKQKCRKMGAKRPKNAFQRIMLTLLQIVLAHFQLFSFVVVSPSEGESETRRIKRAGLSKEQFPIVLALRICALEPLWIWIMLMVRFRVRARFKMIFSTNCWCYIA